MTALQLERPQARRRPRPPPERPTDTDVMTPVGRQSPSGVPGRVARGSTHPPPTRNGPPPHAGDDVQPRRGQASTRGEVRAPKVAITIRGLARSAATLVGPAPLKAATTRGFAPQRPRPPSDGSAPLKAARHRPLYSRYAPCRSRAPGSGGSAPPGRVPPHSGPRPRRSRSPIRARRSAPHRSRSPVRLRFTTKHGGRERPNEPGALLPIGLCLSYDRGSRNRRGDHPQRGSQAQR